MLYDMLSHTKLSLILEILMFLNCSWMATWLLSCIHFWSQRSGITDLFKGVLWSGFNKIWTHDLCDTGVMLYQLSYEASFKAGQEWVQFIHVTIQCTQTLPGTHVAVAYCPVLSLPALWHQHLLPLDPKSHRNKWVSQPVNKQRCVRIQV